MSSAGSPPPHSRMRTHAMRARTHPRSTTQSGTHTTHARHAHLSQCFHTAYRPLRWPAAFDPTAARRVRDRAAAVSRLMTDASPRAPESAEAAAAPESVDGKRRSRWGAKTEDAAGNSEAPAPARKRSRWGSKPAQSTDPVTLAVQLGIPLATLQQMTAEQQQMLPVIKSKIDEVDLQ